MNRYKVYTLLFLFSVLLFTGIAIDATAIANPPTPNVNPQVEKIRAKIARLEFVRQQLVLERTQAQNAVTRLLLDRITILDNIEDAIAMVSQLEAEVAMAQNEAERQQWERFLFFAQQLLRHRWDQYDESINTETALQLKITHKDNQIAVIDTELAKLQAELAALLQN